MLDRLSAVSTGIGVGRSVQFPVGTIPAFSTISTTVRPSILSTFDLLRQVRMSARRARQPVTSSQLRDSTNVPPHQLQGWEHEARCHLQPTWVVKKRHKQL